MEEIKDIIEILSLADDEIKKNDKNASAILDLQDLKSLKCLYNKYIEEKEKNLFLEGFKVGAEEAIKELKEKNKKLEEENKNYKIINETLNNICNSLEKSQKFLNNEFEEINKKIKEELNDFRGYTYETRLKKAQIIETLCKAYKHLDNELDVDIKGEKDE